MQGANNGTPFGDFLNLGLGCCTRTGDGKGVLPQKGTCMLETTGDKASRPLPFERTAVVWAEASVGLSPSLRGC